MVGEGTRARAHPAGVRAARGRALGSLLLALSLGACDDDAGLVPLAALEGGADAARDAGPRGADAGGAELPGFCARADDEVAELFCALPPREITSLADLTAPLRLHQKLLLGHSTALGGRLVSPINPRAVLLRLDADHAAAFTRGQQRVELLARDRVTGRLNFYLVEFSQACNAEPEGCTPGDLFTPAIEQDWLALRVRDDEELRNTAFDCRRCHVTPESAGRALLLMRELRAPWLHWFDAQFGVLHDDFRAARDREPYAGPTLFSGPILLENLIGNAERDDRQSPQPLLFNSSAIGFETMELAQLGFAATRGPGADDPDLSRSPTWQMLYDAYRSGRAPAPPYHHERITDPDKLAAATQAYRAFVDGELRRAELPDISDVLPDDAQRLAEMGLGVEPFATAPELLIQACAECHHAGLDQSVSRARFDADLSRVQPDALARAIERLELPEHDELAMPPLEARPLRAAQRQELIAYLASVDLAAVTPWTTPERVGAGHALELAHHFRDDAAPSEGLVIGDVSGDGLADLVSPPRVFVQRPDGSLADAVTLAPEPCCKVALADVDADGLLDVVSAGTSDGQPEVERGLVTFVSRGDLRFAAGIASPGPTLRALDRTRAADVNLDGKLDLVGIGPGNAAVAYLGDGHAAFSPRVIALDDAPDASFGDLVLSDLTGDGLPDLVLFDHQAWALAVYAHDAVAGFEPTAARYALPASVLARPAKLAVGDTNADARDDVVLAFEVLGGGVRQLLRDAEGGFAPGPALGLGAGPLALADMDGNGRADLVTMSTGGVNVLLQGESGLAAERARVFATPSAPGSVLDTIAVGDLSDDGCLDVAVALSGSVIVLHGVGCAR